MADAEVATKAPESDAQETHIPQDSDIPADGKTDDSVNKPQDQEAAQGSASMGEHCVTDRPTPAGRSPTGELTKFNDIDVYISKPPDYPHSQSKLLLLLTGGTGVHSTNNQLQADDFAAEGFVVVMPDQFGGDNAPTTIATGQLERRASIIDQVKIGFVAIAKSFTIDMWLARHTPETVLPRLHKVITAIKEDFADAIASGGGIHAVGYCFGARYVLLLAAAEEQTPQQTQPDADSQAEQGTIRKGPQIKAGAIAHGTQISREEIANAAVPLCIVAVEQDSLFPDEVREEGVKALQAKKVEHEVKVYPDVPHGFAVLGDYEDGTIVEKQKEAFGQMLAWLKAH